ncbi:unnamed protein product [Candidula unifasciata]|uniref:FAM194 C-terminal domain-containing protein n=1 Tax=Candidula unifasciata TaxID=100452 RepID=A0A8S3YXL4_9EUPU|nr:unnamed protein product [Candidula unifasciata]
MELTLQDDDPNFKTQSRVPESGASNKKRLPTKSSLVLPEIVENSASYTNVSSENLKVSDGSMLQVPKCHKQERQRSTDSRGLSSMAGKFSGFKKGLRENDNMSAVSETASDIRSVGFTSQSYYMPVIQFQLSSKACEEKGWICQKGKEDELAKEAVLEYCIQRLQQELKQIKEQRIHEAEMGLNSPVIVRYYGDSHRETLLKYRKPFVKSSSNSSIKDGKPCIPNMSDDVTESRNLFMASHMDGTTVAYYPSGRLAVVASAAGFSHPGFYTIVYDDDPDKRMLAVFVPSGRGVCYHANGNIRFLSTTKGGHVANKDGRVIRHWKWPQSQMKLSTPVQIQLNQHMSFRCAGENHCALILSCQKETAKFFVHAAIGATNHKHDEQEQLLTSFKFSSKAAKDILRLNPPKTKLKSKKKKDKLTKQLAELVKSVDSQDKILYDLESDKELARLQRKVRNLVDDWLEHYRITIGLQSPTLRQISDTPHKPRTETWSAKTADRKEDRGVPGPARSPSAPSKSSSLKTRNNSTEVAPTIAILSSAPSVKFSKSVEYSEKEGQEADIVLTFSSFIDQLSNLSESNIRDKSGSSSRKSAVSRQPTNITIQEKENKIMQLSLCPVVLRKQLLGDSSSQCRCSRDVIPYIMDIEYETYISKVAPENQLQIIAVVSSNYPETNLAETMLNQIYENQNRSRTRPCLQCHSDTFRLLRYDINTAMEGSDHTLPYLLSQHNVVPGMFLIYAGGNLIFCDHIFNGYGKAKRDFQKQVMKSRLDFLRGMSIPRDFRFSPSSGPHGLRSPWGGEIGGPGVDHYGSSGRALVNTLSTSERDYLAGGAHGNTFRKQDMAKFLSLSL